MVFIYFSCLCLLVFPLGRLAVLHLSVRILVHIWYWDLLLGVGKGKNRMDSQGILLNNISFFHLFGGLNLIEMYGIIMKVILLPQWSFLSKIGARNAHPINEMRWNMNMKPNLRIKQIIDELFNSQVIYVFFFSFFFFISPIINSQTHQGKYIIFHFISIF